MVWKDIEFLEAEEPMTQVPFIDFDFGTMVKTYEGVMKKQAKEKEAAE